MVDLGNGEEDRPIGNSMHSEVVWENLSVNNRVSHQRLFMHGLLEFLGAGIGKITTFVESDDLSYITTEFRGRSLVFFNVI